MVKLQFVSFLLVMAADVVAYQVFSRNDIQESEHRKVKRHIMTNGGCPEGFIVVSYECVPMNKSYNNSQVDDYVEITTEFQDENVTLQPDPTPGHSTPTTPAETTPHSRPMSAPDGTPHPHKLSSPGSTKRPRKTPPPRSTLPSSSMPSPTTTSRPAPVVVSRAETTSSPHAMAALILFVLCVFLLHCEVRLQPY